MNRIQAVLEKGNHSYSTLYNMIDRCPGNFIDGLPKVGKNPEQNCGAGCSACWETEVEPVEGVADGKEL